MPEPGGDVYELLSGTDLTILYLHGVGGVLICDGIRIGGVKGVRSTE